MGVRLRASLFGCVVAIALAGCGAPPTTAMTAMTTSRVAEAVPLALPDGALEMTTAGAPAGAALPLLIGFHGRNGAPENLVPIARALAVPARVVLLRGEREGRGHFTWWREASVDVGDDATAAATFAKARAIDAAIAAIVRARPTLGRPVLFGRSQGGNLALAVALEDPAAIGAVFVMSSAVLPPLFAFAPPPAGPRPPIFAFHGAADERVPIELARATATRMRTLGYPFELTEYPDMGHVVEEQELQKARPEIEDALRREAKR